MENRKAIVTLAIGDEYFSNWKNICESNWRRYAEKYSFDLICIDKPLDNSSIRKARFLSWQKCLILSQEYAKKYDRILWMDSDILINNSSAPDPTEIVPIDKVGVVEILNEPTKEWYDLAYKRLEDYWGKGFIRYNTPEEYYTRCGFPKGFKYYAGDGFMVLSPKHHRELLENVYYNYEDKGRHYHDEMRPFSFELLNSNLEYFLEFRFNINFLDYLIVHYPFLMNKAIENNKWKLFMSKFVSLFNGYTIKDIKKSCVTAALLDSYFLHFAGPTRGYMKHADLKAESWRDCALKSV